MMLAKEQHMWTCGKGGSVTRRVWRYRMKCDNPDCGRIFYRPGNVVNRSKKRGSENEYCTRHCHNTHFAGVCEHPDCGQKFNRRVKYGSNDRLCRKHQHQYVTSSRRKRGKAALYDRLGNRCACCGERDPMFLQVDHVFNDGAEHRRSTSGVRRGLELKHMLAYLEANPGHLQLLCCNCNYAKHKNGGEIYRPAKFTRRQLEIAA